MLLLPLVVFLIAVSSYIILLIKVANNVIKRARPAIRKFLSILISRSPFKTLKHIAKYVAKAAIVAVIMRPKNIFIRLLVLKLFRFPVTYCSILEATS